MYRHLNITGNPDPINFDRFGFATDLKKGATVFEFYNGDKWVSLTKQTGKFLATKTLRNRFGGLKAMKNFLCTVETPPTLRRSLEVATKLRRKLLMDIEMESIPLELLSSLVEDIHVKTREASQNTDVDM